ncbi:hypothetical protein [Halorussus halobius]|uniref:hypothetical protein n=1 Tax=Halorussus halobius TaxID=1710537 RepID=UPI001092F3CD|nr:hypothetical protein [Halorussus halobius]
MDSQNASGDAPAGPLESDFPSPVALVAAHLAVAVAVVHLSMGLFNWFRWANAGFLIPRDLRWPLFVVSGLALFAGLVVAAQGRYRRPLYAGGIALMATYVVGYFGWHMGGHRPQFIVGRGTTHQEPFVSVFVDHLFAGPVEFLAIVAEVALAAVLAYLLVRES